MADSYKNEGTIYYNIHEINKLVAHYDLLGECKIDVGEDEPVYHGRMRGRRVYSPGAAWESSIDKKVDLDSAIRKLTGQEKFMLLATVYYGDRGCNCFGRWLDDKILPQDREEYMRQSGIRVLRKLKQLMNHQKVERRGGFRPNAGRKKKSKNQTAI